MLRLIASRASAARGFRTAVAAELLDESALLEAIGRRSVYASEDQDLALRFYAGGRVPMGGEIGTIDDTVGATLSVADPDYDGPYTVSLYRGRVGARAVEVTTETELDVDGAVSLDLAVPGAGTYFFYVEVHETGPDRMAWTAPIWVERN